MDEYKFNNPRVDIVVGLQYGDEGKGKVVHHLANAQDHYDFCIRYNGGANAGHTIYHEGKKIVTHQIPSGILYGIISVIGDNCYFDFNKLMDEIKMLENNGIQVRDKLVVSSNCHIIQKKHLETDGCDSKIGTTKRGIGPCAIDKYGRIGEKLKDNESVKEILHNLGVKVCKVSKLLYHFFLDNKREGNILVEGAQGYGLDINHGDYPYVTSSHCISSDVFNLGVSYSGDCKVWGVAKIYETYVGAKTFQQENDVCLEKMQSVGNEFGSTTERPRQCNYLNLNTLVESCFINHVNIIVINKCDILEKINEFRMFDEGIMKNYYIFDNMKNDIKNKLMKLPNMEKVIFSESPNHI
tara:strand:- start:23 stop:1084 length:1062 start_codon:yes stop_codon:yes gene_type:complete